VGKRAYGGSLKTKRKAGGESKKKKAANEVNI